MPTITVEGETLASAFHVKVDSKEKIHVLRKKVLKKINNIIKIKEIKEIYLSKVDFSTNDEKADQLKTFTTKDVFKDNELERLSDNTRTIKESFSLEESDIHFIISIKITLKCIVQGETPPFNVDININEKVSELREKVYDFVHEKSDPKIKDITLWKVNVPENCKIIKDSIKNNNKRDDERIKQQLKTLTIEKLKILGCECEELSDTTETIQNIFKFSLKQINLYIIASIGETFASAFPVKVNFNDDVYALRKSILKEIYAPKNEKDITLWKVNIPMNHEIIKEFKKNITIEDKCKKLSNILEPIKDIFEFPLNEENVHVIISIDLKAYITFLHGFVDRIDFYDHIFSKFSKEGIEVNAFDRRGHGRTSKKVGNSKIGEGWKDAIQDIKKFIEKQEQRENRKKEAPHFLMGHGVLALYYATICDQPLSGYIALSPLLKALSVPQIIHAGKLFNKLLPYFAIKVDDEPEHYASNYSFSQLYEEDTYLNKYITITEAIDFIKNGSKLLKKNFLDENFNKNAERCRPILLMYGIGDNVSKTGAVKEFYNLIEEKMMDKDSENEHFHCLHYGNTKDGVIDYCKNWILSGGKHIKKNSEND
ncbi:14870_t:CDS:2, partial [Gigaspora rosea]